MDRRLRQHLPALAGVPAALAAALTIAACGGDESTSADSTTAEAGCSATYALPIAAAELEPDGVTVRMAYAGPEPCRFATTTYNGELYVELRTSTEEEPSIDPTELAGCVQGELEEPLPTGTRVTPVTGATPEPDASLEQQGRDLLDSGDCAEVERGAPAFTIN